jgi:EAL domain-containing protein (putative c-di-GMP-specific phosphodiesterase class I)
MHVVAEGVETGPVRDWLAELTCELAQGFYICVPLPAEQLDLGVEASR